MILFWENFYKFKKYCCEILIDDRCINLIKVYWGFKIYLFILFKLEENLIFENFFFFNIIFYNDIEFCCLL